MDSSLDRIGAAVKTLTTKAPWRLMGSIALWALPIAFMGLFFFYPLGKITALAVSRSSAEGALPLWQALRSPYIARIIGFTFWQASLSTLLTVAVGLPAAYIFARYDFRGKSFLRSLTGIPFVLPTLVVAAAFNALIGPRGWLNLALMLILNLKSPPLTLTNSLTAIVLAHIFYNLTIVIRLVGDYWARLDPRLGKAAQVLGCTPGKVFWQVTLPLLLPAVLAAALLIFIFDFTSFGVILVLGGPRFATLEVEIYYQITGLFNLPLAMALSLIQLGCTLGMTILYNRLSEPVTRPSNIWRSKFSLKAAVGRRERLLIAAVIGFLLLFQVSPLAALVARSFVRAGPERGEASISTPQFSLAAYRELFINRRESLFYIPPARAVSVSLGYALTTVFLSLILGLPAAWLLAQSSNGLPLLNRLKRWLDPLLMLPLGTSSLTLGLGFIIAFDRPPLDLRASPFLIPLAHTLVAFPFVVRSLTPALKSIRPRLRQAAAMLGADPVQSLWRVDLPLAGRALFVAAVFAFSISLGEFGATALLARPEYPTIPVAIYRFLSQPGELNYAQSLALSVILMLVTTAGMLAMERFRVGEIGEF
ncbi:MAG: ABC transporter permease [Chloroflexota bacterium]